MPQRTYKVNGYAYATSGDVTISVNFNGSNVYNGTVDTSATEFAGELSTLASFTADTSVTGSVPVSISVSGGTVRLGVLSANYSNTITLAELQEQYPDQTAEDYTALLENSFAELNNNDAEEALDYRANVNIDSEDVTATFNDEKDNNDTRGWHYTVNDGSTITFNLTVDPSAMPANVEDL